MSHTSILWKRVDLPGHEFATLRRAEPGWALKGTALFAHQGQGCRLDYEVMLDNSWSTRSAWVRGSVHRDDIDLTIAAIDGRWTLNGTTISEVEGCTDLDLNFSPSTNLLPIRRLQLRVGERREVRAAWLRFPSFRLEPLSQLYHRLSESRYRYSSGGGSFVAELEVHESGFSVRYGDLWVAEGPPLIVP